MQKRKIIILVGAILFAILAIGIGLGVKKHLISNDNSQKSSNVQDNNSTVNQKDSEKEDNDNSFSESNETIDSSKQDPSDVKDNPTNDNQSNVGNIVTENNQPSSEQNNNQSNNVQPNNDSTVVQNPQENNQSQDNNSNIVEDSQVNNNNSEESSSSDDESNKFYYSITKGRAEYSDQSECYSDGLRIQNNEINGVMDWNFDNPNNQKQPVIKSSMCIGVMKNGIEYYYLHFVTTTGVNLDDELKSLYK